MTLDLGITRRQRYVSNVTAENLTTSSYAQGGTITSYTYSGTTYIAHVFTASGIFTVTSDIYPLEVFAVGGGGGGGNSGLGSGSSGGGGGGGGIVTGHLLNTIRRPYASASYLASTTSTQANVVGGWTIEATDFTGLGGAFQFNWRAVQQIAGGARTAPLPEITLNDNRSFQQFYLEIGITAIGPVDVAVGLIRDGQVLDGYNNVPYVNLNGGTVGNWVGAPTALGTFVGGDTLQIAWDNTILSGASNSTYWWAGRNNTWNSTPFNTAVAGRTTGTYTTGTALRMIFMCAASGGGQVRGVFRSGNENIYTPPAATNAYASVISDYSGFYTTPLGLGSSSAGSIYGVTIGAGGGTGQAFTSGVSGNVGTPGSNGGDTVIYNNSNPSFYYSAYFSNSYITATNAAFAFGTSDFTIETWLYPTALGGNSTYVTVHPIFNSRSFTGVDTANAGFSLYIDNTNRVGMYTSGTTYLTTVNTVTNNAWNHLAVTRNSNIFSVYINGIKDSTTFTASGTQNFTNNRIMIGYGSNQTNLSLPYFYTGYLSNYRIVRGLAVYTNNFTPPTTISSSTQAAGTNINAITTQTALLVFNTATIRDLSTLSNVLTQNSGTVSVSSFAPFNTSTVLFRAFGGGGGGSAPMMPGQQGGSGGGGAGSFATPFGSGGAAIPGQGSQGGQGGQALGSGGGGYAYPGSPGINGNLWDVANRGGYGGAGGYFNYSGAMVAYGGGGGGGAWSTIGYASGAGGIGGGGNGAWINASSVQVNATAGTVNSGGGGGGANNGQTNAAAAGGSGIVIFRYPAFLGDAARFPSNLTDPYFKNTTLLLSGQRITTATNNSIVIDSSYNAVAINTGTTTLAQGAFTPYGSVWSTSFNGITDFTSFVSTVTTGTSFQQNVLWGANKSFTIEAWLNPNTNQVSNTSTVILGDVQPTGPGLAWSVGLDASNKPMMYWRDSVYGNNFLTATNTLSTGTWTHVAWVANAGTPTIFINGANQFLSTSTISTLTNTTQTFGIVSGAYFNKFYNGSISNLRVSTSALYSPNLSLASSGYFNGSSYLTSATSTAMVFGTSNFTVEFWVFWITVGGVGTYNQIVGKVSSANSVGFGAGSGRWYMTTNTAGYDSGIAIATGQWYHVAWVRNSGVVTLYLNGAASGYAPAFATSITDTGFDIGGSSLSAIQYSNIYVSNIRILNGTALYTTAPFTVPTPNLTNITNTTLLTFLTTSTTFTNYISPSSTIAIGGGSPSFVGYTPVPVASFTPPTAPFNASGNTIFLAHNTFKHGDSSTSSFAFSTGTMTSLPKIQKYSPYSLGYPYNTISLGGSASFNGNTDFLYTNTLTNNTMLSFNGTTSYLSVPNSGALDLASDSPDWTIECWFYANNLSGPRTILWKDGVVGGKNPSYGVYIWNITSGYPRLQWIVGGTVRASGGTAAGGANYEFVTEILTNTWYYFALVKSANTLTGYLNGIAEGPVTIDWTLQNLSGPLTIGAAVDPNSRNFFAGSIVDLRVTKTAIYSNNFTSPLAELTATSSTQLLTLLVNGDSNGFSPLKDYSTNALPVFPVGNPTFAVTTIFTGTYTTSTVTLPSLQLDSDFSVECWVYTTATTAQCIFDFAGKEGNGLRPNSFALNMAVTSGLLSFSYGNTTSPNSNTGIVPFTWTHIAVTRINGFMSIYQNGIQTLTVSSSTNFSNGQITIGRNGPTAASYFSGYISDFRIVKGQSIYNGNFNPPVAPLRPIDNGTSTSLLLNFNNIGISDATMQNNIVTLNSATISSNVTKYNSKSISFSGITDYLIITPVSTASYALGISDFTVEMWIYINPQTTWTSGPYVNTLQATTVRSIFDMRTTNTAGAGFDICLGTTGTLLVSTLSSSYIRGTTILATKTWYHIAFVRQSNNFVLYLNGIVEGSPYIGTTAAFINPIVRIGFGAGGAGYFNGYIDDLRITRGVARYTSAFLVPQKALPVK